MNNNKQNDQIVTSMFAAIEQRRRVLATGLTEVDALRVALERAVRQLGVRVEYDSSSRAELVDYFGLAVLGGASGALTGAGFGALVGALLDDVESGMALGAVVGGIFGATTGVAAVERGWRLRMDHSGVVPVAILEPKE